MGHRTYLGAGVSTLDNGRAVDLRAVIGIKDKRHPLHHRHDPYRYSLDNPEFKAFVRYIVDNGPPPQPGMFRKSGLLTARDPELAYLKKTYPDKVAQHPEQPRLELVYGNRRMYGLLAAEEVWAQQGGSKWQGSDLLAVYKALDDEEMESEFVLENSNRARSSIFEDQLTVRAELAKNKEWAYIADLLKQPKAEVLRLHRPLTEAHLAVVQAFSTGSISRGFVLRLIQTISDKAQQVAALDEPSLVPARPAAQKTIKAAALPRDSLWALLYWADPKSPSPTAPMQQHIDIVKAWLEKLPPEENQ